MNLDPQLVQKMHIFGNFRKIISRSENLSWTKNIKLGILYKFLSINYSVRLHGFLKKGLIEVRPIISKEEADSYTFRKQDIIIYIQEAYCKSVISVKKVFLLIILQY